MTRIEVQNIDNTYKAKAIKADGVWYLVSYEMVVAQIDCGVLTMHMRAEDMTNTTKRHVKEFVRRFAEEGTDWKKAKVVL